MSESVIKITSFSLILREHYTPISTIHFVPNPFLVAATFTTWAPLKKCKGCKSWINNPKYHVDCKKKDNDDKQKSV